MDQSPRRRVALGNRDDLCLFQRRCTDALEMPGLSSRPGTISLGRPRRQDCGTRMALAPAGRSLLDTNRRGRPWRSRRWRVRRGLFQGAAAPLDGLLQFFAEQFHLLDIE